VQLFYFVLKTPQQTIPDPEGQELVDRAAARQHAVAVARQLMRNREVATRRWRIEVCDDYLHPLFEVFFVEVDETLPYFPPHLQASIEGVLRTAAALNDAIAGVKTTLSKVRQTLGQADRLLARFPGRRG
jgi:hypothetical protein